MRIEWKQKGNMVYFDFLGDTVYFVMPDDFRLEQTNPNLLKLAEYLMFSPWYDYSDIKLNRKKGKHIGLSFSAGVDSTAAMLLLPEDTPLVYVQRDGIEDGILKQENALRMIKKLKRDGRKVINVKTNFEIIRTKFGLQVGYSTTIGMGVPLILLGDYLDLGQISFGKVFDDQYFPKGVFRDYTKDYIYRQKLLNDCGLEGFYPTVGCSEVITTEIVDKSKYSKYAISCLRSSIEGQQCNNCFKCFRKNILRGKQGYLDRESLYAISKNPPKMATSLLYGFKKRNVHLMGFEHLDEMMEQDLSFLNKIYYPAYDIYSKKDQKYILDKLKSLGYEKMTKKEIEKLKNLNFLIKSKEIEKNLPSP